MFNFIRNKFKIRRSWIEQLVLDKGYSLSYAGVYWEIVSPDGARTVMYSNNDVTKFLRDNMKNLAITRGGCFEG